MNALTEELQNAGITCYGGENDKSNDEMNLSTLPPVQAIVSGFDLQYNYNKICKTTHYLSMGAKFFVANEDTFDKLSKSMILPENGSIVKSILQGKPDTKYTVVAKPNPFVVSLISFDLDIPEGKKKRMLMIGDRLDTDIQLGKSADIDTCLVMSGATTVEELDKEVQIGMSRWEDSLCPTYVLNSL